MGQVRGTDGYQVIAIRARHDCKTGASPKLTQPPRDSLRGCHAAPRLG